MLPINTTCSISQSMHYILLLSSSCIFLLSDAFSRLRLVLSSDTAVYVAKNPIACLLASLNFFSISFAYAKIFALVCDSRVAGLSWIYFRCFEDKSSFKNGFSVGPWSKCSIAFNEMSDNHLKPSLLSDRDTALCSGSACDGFIAKYFVLDDSMYFFRFFHKFLN